MVDRSREHQRKLTQISGVKLGMRTLPGTMPSRNCQYVTSNRLTSTLTRNLKEPALVRPVRAVMADPTDGASASLTLGGCSGRLGAKAQCCATILEETTRDRLARRGQMLHPLHRRLMPFLCPGTSATAWGKSDACKGTQGLQDAFFHVVDDGIGQSLKIPGGIECGGRGGIQ